MKKNLIRELEAVEKKERKLLAVEPANNRIKQSIYEKVPDSLCSALEAAFAKAFRLVFLKGTQAIEKTFDKESAGLDYEAGNYVVDKAGSRKSIKRLDKGARKGDLLNNKGIPVVGVIGGFVNHAAYRKTSSFAGLKYKKRYLLKKLEAYEENGEQRY